MTGFNLPPGCSVSDIPGNRPEDEREEAFWDALTERCREEGEGCARDLERLLDAPHSYERVIELARDLALNEGFAQGRDDERMARANEEMERAEAERNAPLPEPDTGDNRQNAWVQDWLTAYQRNTAPAEVTVGSVLDADAFERVIECVQETYGGGQ